MGLQATSSDSYQWSYNGVEIPGATDQIYTVTEEGSYSVNIVTGSCSITSSNFVITNEFPTAPIVSFSDTTGCVPLAVDFTHNLAGVTTQWLIDGALVSTDLSFQTILSQPGCVDIGLILTSLNDCELSVSNDEAICIEENPIASFIMNPNIISNEQEAINFINTSEDADSYLWDLGNGSTSDLINPNQVYSINENGYQIILTAYNELGCSDEYSLTLISNEVGTIYIPNTFTPDGDEHNQEFSPTLLPGFDVFSYQFQIYNRWGELVFNSLDINFGWDGTYGPGALQAQQGVYIWKMTYRDQTTNQRKELVGHVNLIR